MLSISAGRHKTAAIAVLAVVILSAMALFTITSGSGTNAESTTYEMDVKYANGTITDPQGIQYTISGDTAEITGFTYSGVQELIFPSSISYKGSSYTVIGVPDDESYWSYGKYFQDVNVTKLTVYVDYSDYWLSSDLFKYNHNLESLTIVYNEDNEDALCSIGSSAFDQCLKLSEINLPDRLGTLGITVFANCTALVSLTFNTSVKEFSSYGGMSGYMFTGCTGLKELILEKNVDNLEDTLFTKRSDTGYYTACTSLEIVYNAGAKVTQSAVESAVRESGSDHVLIYNLCGGDLQETAANYSQSGNHVTVTMPSATISNSSGDNVSIPSWTDKNGNKYNSLTDSTVQFGTTAGTDDYIFQTLYGNCTITYHYDGKVIYTQEVTCEYATPLLRSVEGYDIDSWNSEENGSGTSYLCGQTVVIIGDMDLYAQVTETGGQEITITYSYTGKSGWSSTTYTYSEDAESGRTMTVISASDFQKNARSSSGKTTSDTVLYWYTSDGVYYAAGSQATFDKSVTLTGTKNNVQLSTVTITYVANNGTADSTVYSYSVRSGSSASLTVKGSMYSYEGHIFKGWSESSTADTASYFQGDKVTSTKTLYAVWQDTDMGDGTVVFNSNNGKGETHTQDVKLGDVDTVLDKVDFIWNGHVLLGWSEDPDATFISYTTEMKVYLTESVVLYAVWAEGGDVPYAVIVADNAILTYDGQSHDVFQGIAVLGLSTGSVNVTGYYLVDADGNAVLDEDGNKQIQITESGVYYYTIECQILDADGNDVTSSYEVTVYNGTVTVKLGSGHSSVSFE